MAFDELLILHGLNGGNNMASYRNVWDPRQGRYVRRRTSRSRRKTSSLSGLGAFGTGTSIKTMLGGVKGVLITGAIAAGGAITTDALFEKVAAKLEIEGWQRDLAKMATGVALGILIAKILKKPKLAAAFAIGPVVAGAMRIFAEVLGPVSGLGMTLIEPADRYTSMYAPFYGTEKPPALPVGSLTSFSRADSLTSPAPYMAQAGQAAQSIYV